MATDNRELRYPTGIADLSDLDIYANGLPHEAFRALRERAPVFWNPEENGPGYWAITRYQDVVAISKKPQLYSNALGGHYISYESMGINDPEAQNAFLHMLLAMDPPEHNLHRRLIAPAFNPSIVRNFEAGVRRKVGQLLDRVAHRGECDFVTEIATPLPLWTLSELLGVPEEDRADIIRWSNEALALMDPDYFENPEAGQHVFEKMFQYGKAMMARRREEPRDDLLSVMANTRIDGAGLPQATLDGFFVLMVLAGNETTRNTIAGGMRALTEHPEQRARLLADRALLPNAVEEMLRYVSAIVYMRRTAADDTMIRDQRIARNDKVVMWYGAANYDDEVFENPYQFDVSRANAREHLAFGIGQHFCIGSQLARMQIRVMYEEILERFPDMQASGSYSYLRSNHLSGLKSMPVVFTPVS
ncbi:MAG: cytochrome P450 [Gammaproteobacteria bacterium]